MEISLGQGPEQQHGYCGAKDEVAKGVSNIGRHVAAAHDDPANQDQQKDWENIEDCFRHGRHSFQKGRIGLSWRFGLA